MTKAEAKELFTDYGRTTNGGLSKTDINKINAYLDDPDRGIKFEDDDHSNCIHLHTTRIGINTTKCNDCGKQYPIIQ